MPADSAATSSLSRSHALRLLGAAGGGLLLGACSGGGAAVSAAGIATPSATSGVTAVAGCAVTDEGEIGPYFVDDSLAGFNRSNITANIDGTNVQPGIPLTLTITVRDAQKSCAPVSGSQVDIWHCNALGVYSGEGVESTVGQTWLRGYQTTDANGQVTFITIVPGWYGGRTTHIHLRVRSSYSNASSTSDGSNTTQVFFDQSLIDSLDTSVAPYAGRGVNTTTNANDRVSAGQMHGTGVLSLAGSASSGYTAAYTIDLPITAG